MLSNNFLFNIKQIQKKYHGLIFNEKAMMLYGTVNVDSEGQDNYDVEINLNSYPKRFPSVKETAGRIPLKEDRHINIDNTFCFTTIAKEQILLKKQIKNIIDFIDKILIPFLQNNSYYEINKKYRNGEYSHAIIGVLESYSDILKLKDLSIVINVLMSRLKNKKYGKNEICFCGSRKKIKNCHLYLYNELFFVEKSVIINDLDELFELLEKIKHK